MTAQAITRPKEKWYKNLTKEKVRKFFMGSKDHEGFLKMFFIYALLICIGFIYLYPMLYMISNSFMNLDDLLDSSINWIPGSFNISNYIQAGKSMEFWKSFGQSILVAGIPTICNLVSCSLIGYGLARFEFKAKKLVLGVIIFSFILPSQITMIPTYVLFSKLGILGTLWTFILPAILGVGLNAPIFILIFYQFFRQVPKVLIEAAQIDGAGPFTVFFKIMLPQARPIVVSLSVMQFISAWNSYDVPLLYLPSYPTLSTALYLYKDNMFQLGLSTPTYFAGMFISIIPVAVLFLIFNKQIMNNISIGGLKG